MSGLSSCQSFAIGPAWKTTKVKAHSESITIKIKTATMDVEVFDENTIGG